jgi:hypothetical protein
MAATNVSVGGSLNLLDLASFVDELVQRRKTQRELKNVTYGPTGPEGVNPVRMSDPRYARAIESMFQTRGTQAGTSATQQAATSSKQTGEWLSGLFGGPGQVAPQGVEALVSAMGLGPRQTEADASMMNANTAKGVLDRVSVPSVEIEKKRADSNAKLGQQQISLESLKAIQELLPFLAQGKFADALSLALPAPGEDPLSGLRNYLSTAKARQEQMRKDLADKQTNPKTGKPLSLIEQTYESPDLLNTWKQYYESSTPLKVMPNPMGPPAQYRVPGQVPERPTSPQHVSELLTRTGNEAMSILDELRGAGQDMSLGAVQTRSKKVERLRTLREQIRAIKPIATKLGLSDIDLISRVESIIDTVLPK